MSSVPGVLYLADAVRTDFTARGITANVLVTFGKERWKQINQGPGGANRVIFIVGDLSGKGGKYGKEFGGRGPGRAPKFTNGVVTSVDPRPLISADESLLVSTWAHALPDDATLPGTTAEEKTIAAEANLFEEVVRSVHRAVHFGALWGGFTWNTDPAELRFGIERLSELTLRGVYFDVAETLKKPGPSVGRGTLT